MLIKTIPHKDTERAWEIPKVFTYLLEEIFDTDPPPPPPSHIRVDNESNFSCRMDDIFAVLFKVPSLEDALDSRGYTTSTNSIKNRIILDVCV